MVLKIKIRSIDFILVENGVFDNLDYNNDMIKSKIFRMVVWGV